MPAIAAAGVAAVGAAAVMTDTRFLKLLLVVPAIALVVTIPLETVLVTWLFAAPLVQGATAASSHGHIFYTAFFMVPPLVVTARLLREGSRRVRLGLVDALPALYVVLVVFSVRVLRSDLTGGDTTLRGIYSDVVVGPVAYYVMLFAKLSDRFPVRAVRALLWAGVVAAFFALVDFATSWNVWHSSFGQGGIHRATSTFKSPFDLGTFLGMTAALAVATLVWRGPRRLRLPSIVLLVLAGPALVSTFSRGPIIAAVLVGVVLVLLASRTRWRSAFLLFVIVSLLYVSWGEITSSHIYGTRFSVTSTITDRVAVQQASVELFQRKPFFGWGYQTFDQAKLLVPTRYQTRVDTTTSHNTFLTVLVETGVLGLALLVVPWLVALRRGITAALRGRADLWLVGGCAGAVAVYVLGALDYDARFFPLILAMPYIAVGLVRRALVGQSYDRAAEGAQ